MKWMVVVVSLLCVPAMALEVGDAAPTFSAENQDGETWKLEDHVGTKPVVVYFYPAAMTGGCTKQACAYRDYVAKGDAAFTVVGVSGDQVDGLNHFRTAEGLNFDLLSDPDGAVAKAFGVPFSAGEKSIEREVDGEQVTLTRTATTRRWTFVVGHDGTIIYKSDAVKPTEDLAAVLTFLEL